MNKSNGFPSGVRFKMMAEGVHPGSAQLHSAPELNKDADDKSAVPGKTPFSQTAPGFQPSFMIAPSHATFMDQFSGSPYTVAPKPQSLPRDFK